MALRSNTLKQVTLCPSPVFSFIEPFCKRKLSTQIKRIGNENVFQTYIFITKYSGLVDFIIECTSHATSGSPEREVEGWWKPQQRYHDIGFTTWTQTQRSKRPLPFKVYHLSSWCNWITPYTEVIVVLRFVDLKGWNPSQIWWKVFSIQRSARMLPVVKYYVFGCRWLLITYVQGMMNALYEHAGSVMTFISSITNNL